MTRFFTLFLVLLVTSTATAQWTQLVDLGGSKRFGAMSFTIGQAAHIVGGTVEDAGNYTTFNETWIHGLNSEVWSQVADYAGGTIYGGAAFVIDNVAYVGLGYDQLGNPINELWAYDPNTDQWSQRANFPGDARLFGFSFASNGAGYVGAGANYAGGTSTLLSDCWKYDPLTDAWSQVADYPGGGQIGLAFLTLNGDGYVGIGDNGNAFHNDFYRYNAASDTWEQKASFPGFNRSFCSMVAANGEGYLIGGEQAHAVYTSDMWRYNPTLDAWTQALTFAGLGRGYGNFFFVNGALIYGLGLVGPSDSQCSAEWWKYQLEPVAVSDAVRKGALQVWPNPTTNQVQIQLPEDEKLLQARVYSATGALMAAGEETQWDTSQWPQQVYVIEVETNAGRYVQRVVKQ